MNRKIYGLFIGIIFIANILTSINAVAYGTHDTKNKTGRVGDINVVGVMDRIDKTEEYKDYKIHIVVVLDDSIDIYIAKEDILRLYNPHGLEYGSVVVAYCESWEFI